MLTMPGKVPLHSRSVAVAHPWSIVLHQCVCIYTSPGCRTQSVRSSSHLLLLLSSAPLFSSQLLLTASSSRALSVRRRHSQKRRIFASRVAQHPKANHGSDARVRTQSPADCSSFILSFSFPNMLILFYCEITESIFLAGAFARTRVVRRVHCSPT